MTETALVIPLRSKRATRAQLVQKIQHLFPAILLIFRAGATFQEDPHGVALAIAVVEAVASLLFIASVARAIRHVRTGEPGHAHAVHRIDWPDVFVAGVFFAEGLERWHGGHHKIVQPAFVTAAFMFALGLLHGRIFAAAERRRSLRIDATGITIGKKPFGKFVAAWPSLKSIEIDERYARVIKRDGGERRIDLNDIQDPAPVRRALEDARRRLVQS